MNKYTVSLKVLCVATLLTQGTVSPESNQITTGKAAQKSNVLMKDSLSGRTITLDNVLGDSSIALDATTVIVDSYVVMGECEEGLKARREIERKKDLASQEIQEESKLYEKIKTDYMSKSTTMSDAARDKEEKRLMKMERDLKNLVAEKEEELKHDMQVATEMLAQSLESGVAKLAQSENIDIAFDKMTGRAIYVSDKFNFTEKAIKEVNKNYEIKLAQNKTDETMKIADNKSASSSKSEKANV